MGKQKTTIGTSYRLSLSENALDNLDEIVGYIAFACQEPKRAINVGNKIMKAIERIGRNPLAFRECDELITKSKMYRRAVCLSWQIVYRLIGKEILVLGILHVSRKPSLMKRLRKVR
jgi:plasmid stabilization system protein ParE